MFRSDSDHSILGKFTSQHEFSLEESQRNSWLTQIGILKRQLSTVVDGQVLFEYSIPRMGKRVDVILLIKSTVFVLEFKVGDEQYTSYGIDQVLDYSLDLKNFHAESHDRQIVPILISTNAPARENTLHSYEDLVYSPQLANDQNLGVLLKSVLNQLDSLPPIDVLKWENSIYKPTPTIIEAAQALYKGHNVRDISRSDSDAINLSITADTILKIIERTQRERENSICFVTGVPGSGKTLAGLNLANKWHNTDKGEHAVFLSGNGPLVQVLQEALARDEVAESIGLTGRISKSAALSKTRAFIQNIHHFRDDALQNDQAPIERVAVFDEAQRAWTLEQTRSFMARKKGIQSFGMSEPEFLISVMNRHEDWSVIVCLVGGGQEINTGEAGLPEWFSAIQRRFVNWKVYVSDRLTDQEYTRGVDLFSHIRPDQLIIKRELHLSVSIRSFRSEKLAALVKAILDCDTQTSKSLYLDIKDNYPIVLARNIEKAKDWLKSKARGTERYGLVASSGACRLKPIGLNVKAKIDPRHWFLNDREDVRSSYYLEDIATEFDIQGLELDWICVAWDADFRFSQSGWQCMNFKGTKWQHIRDNVRRQYLKNAYRVLLTRARQGMVILIPEGNDKDETRARDFYDSTFNYLQSIGLSCID